MSAPGRWALLGLPPGPAREVALVPCGGCKGRERAGATARRVAEELRPYESFLVSLPSLLVAGDPEPSRRRLRLADGAVAVAGCEKDCVTALLRPLRAPDHTLVAREDGDPEALSLSLAREVDAVIGVPPLSLDDPEPLPVAALAPRRRFSSPSSVPLPPRGAPDARPAPVERAPAPAHERAPERPVTPTAPTRSSPAPGAAVTSARALGCVPPTSPASRDYFAEPEVPARRGRLPLVLAFALVALAALAWLSRPLWRSSLAGSPRAASQTTQETTR